ncbi:AAA family ATPase [Rhodoferax aquaticus]|uniref:ATPase n=1 Tax=Rhodoferax aquaticus TaxID=2527691 RepID=A0A515EMN0_9BURK|nr:ATP-binding protein [Rhodoferax aquaticus]QDL53902.1 ATPase [Rhodoferax aquaticus]
MKIAILGAESTGKTELARALFGALDQPAGSAIWVAEALREWCSKHQRTPAPTEQWSIAQEQTLRIQASRRQKYVIADTTALMTAIYSDVLFSDSTLYGPALSAHREMDLTLVTGLDLPWIADGIQRDSPQGRERIDMRLREVLGLHRIHYSLIYGVGTNRLDNALKAIAQHSACQEAKSQPACWQWTCNNCSDPACEFRIFSTLTSQGSVGFGVP